MNPVPNQRPNQSPDQSLEGIHQTRASDVEQQHRNLCLQSLEEARHALSRGRNNPEAWLAVVQALRRLREDAEALAVLEEGVQNCPPSPALFHEYVASLESCNRTEEAIAAARKAALLMPDDILMRIKAALMLPVLYRTRDEIEYYRRRFTAGLETISEELRLDTPETRRAALDAIGRHVNLFAGYDGCNERDTQVRYGALVQRIMAANFPQWTLSLQMPPIPTDGRIRIGFISPRFRKHILTDFFIGWMQELDRNRFAVYAYDLGGEEDWLTEKIRQTVEFRSCPNNVESACQAIRSDDLHIAVYFDIGSHPITMQLGTLRLAAVQCTAWGRPVTSGLGTMDYFLSSSMMEPEDAQRHYAERLFCLPGVGVHYTKPVVPRILLGKTREDFGLRREAVVYLCCQRTVKYLPEDDEVLVEIARRVPSAQFVFVPSNAVVGEQLRQRLDGAFSTLGLKAGDHCVMLPRQNRLDYWNLHVIADLFLDTFEWSGGATTMDAVACGLPIVTMPGAMMRGRQSYAILAQLGVADTIARSRAEYVDIAVRLGVDPEWRKSVTRRMVAGYPALFGDTRPVRALEEFFQRVIQDGNSRTTRW